MPLSNRMNLRQTSLPPAGPGGGGFIGPQEWWAKQHSPAVLFTTVTGAYEGVARTVRSFDIHVFVLVTPGTDVFYNRASTGDRVPAIVLGSSPQPGEFLRIQYEVGGKVRK